MKKLVLIILLLPFSVLASTTDTINKILVYEQGNLVYIYPENGVPNAPPCHGSNGPYISFRMDRPMAKEYLSTLLTAMIAQKTVSFRTTGDCRDQSVSETLMYFTIYN